MTTTTGWPTAAAACPGCGFGIAVSAAGGARTVSCPACAERVALAYVAGSYTDKIPCDDRCQYATGPVCSCACGGANHCAGYIAAEQVPVWVRERDAARFAAAAARKAAKANTAAERAAKATEALIAANPVLATLAAADRTALDSGFMLDMQTALLAGKMTDRQVEAAVNALNRDTARAARTAAWAAERAATAAALKVAGVVAPTGKTTVTGTVAHTATQDGDYGITYKMRVVTEAGWTTWGTIPAAIRPDRHEALRGAVVTFTATLTPANGDPTHAWVNRPAAARVITEAPAAPLAEAV